MIKKITRQATTSIFDIHTHSNVSPILSLIKTLAEYNNSDQTILVNVYVGSATNKDLGREHNTCGILLRRQRLRNPKSQQKESPKQTDISEKG